MDCQPTRVASRHGPQVDMDCKPACIAGQHGLQVDMDCKPTWITSRHVLQADMYCRSASGEDACYGRVERLTVLTVLTSLTTSDFEFPIVMAPKNRNPFRNRCNTRPSAIKKGITIHPALVQKRCCPSFTNAHKLTIATNTLLREFLATATANYFWKNTPHPENEFQ